MVQLLQRLLTHERKTRLRFIQQRVVCRPATQAALTPSCWDSARVCVVLSLDMRVFLSPLWLGLGLGGRVLATRRLRNSRCAPPAADAVFTVPFPAFMRSEGSCEVPRLVRKNPHPKLLKRSLPLSTPSFLPLCFLRTRHVSRLFPPHSALSKLKKKKVSCNMLCFPTRVLMRRMNIHVGGCCAAAVGRMSARF